MNVAIILAGGTGSRAGLGIPKQFAKVFNRPLISYVLDAFENHVEVDAIEIVCIESHMDSMYRIVHDEGYAKVRWICVGGATFQESVQHGIENLFGEVQDDDNVLIQYGDSPLVTDEVISDALRVCSLRGNATPAASLVSLAAGCGDGVSTTEYIDRDKVMCLNTPQALRFGYAVWLYSEGLRRGLLGKVDPHTTSLMLAMGERIWFSSDCSLNIKITTKEDFDLFEGILIARQRRNQNASTG